MPSRTSGSRDLRLQDDEQRRAARARPSPATRVDAEVQPACGARTTAKTMDASPRVTVVAPATSTEPRRAVPAGITDGVSADNCHGEGHVDEEHPGPGRELGEDAAEEDPGRAAGGCRGAVDRQRLGQLLRRRTEDSEQQGQGGGCDQRRPGALDGAADQFDGRAAGGAGHQRPGREHDPAGGEDATGSEQVREPAAEEQQAAERDDVGVEDPAEALGCEAEVVLNLRQARPR